MREPGPARAIRQGASLEQIRCKQRIHNAVNDRIGLEQSKSAVLNSLTSKFPANLSSMRPTNVLRLKTLRCGWRAKQLKWICKSSPQPTNIPVLILSKDKSPTFQTSQAIAAWNQLQATMLKLWPQSYGAIASNSDHFLHIDCSGFTTEEIRSFLPN